jgi:hypothetical protein
MGPSETLWPLPQSQVRHTGAFLPTRRNTRCAPSRQGGSEVQQRIPHGWLALILLLLLKIKAVVLTVIMMLMMWEDKNDDDDCYYYYV